MDSKNSKGTYDCLPHYRGLVIKPRVNKEHSDSVIVKNDDPLISFIYAPDPVTGIPRSDIGLMLSKDCSPEVAQYIQNTLMSAHSNISCGDDADFALETTRNFGESDGDYAERLRDIIHKYNNPKD